MDSFDGDTVLFEEDGREFKMPYLSGPKLVELSNWLGLPIAYQQSGPSRWMYLSDLVEHCISHGTIQNLLGTLFGKAGFAKALSGFSRNEADRLYNKTVEEETRLYCHPERSEGSPPLRPAAASRVGALETLRLRLRMTNRGASAEASPDPR